jgi:hypothetical protein
MNGNSPQEQLDGLIRPLIERYPRARWSSFADDLGPLDTAIHGEAGAAAAASPAAAAGPPLEPPDDVMKQLNELMAMQAGLASQMSAINISDGANFAAVEIPEAEAAPDGAAAPEDGKSNGSSPAEHGAGGADAASAEAEAAAGDAPAGRKKKK